MTAIQRFPSVPAADDATVVPEDNSVQIYRRGNHIFSLNFPQVIIQILDGGLVKVARAYQVELNVPGDLPTTCWIARGHEVEFELPRQALTSSVRLDLSHKGRAYFWIGQTGFESMFEVELETKIVRVWGDELFSRMKGSVGFMRPTPRPDTVSPDRADLSDLPDGDKLAQAALNKL